MDEKTMILTNYSFIIVALGTVFLAISAAIAGTVNVYKGQSLISDAIGHASYPGIIFAFIIFQTRNPYLLLLGSFLSGMLCYQLIQWTHRYSKLHLDACLAIYLTGFFGLGMVLKSVIQGGRFHASQSGLEKYIFGQAAYMVEDDVKLIIIIAFIVSVLFILFKQKLIIYIFDYEFAFTHMIATSLMKNVILIMTILTVSIGLKAVGAILISSFMILPCIFANQLSKKFNHVIILGILFSTISAFIGSYLSCLYSGLSTGPCIIIIMSVLTLLAIVFGKYGLIRGKHL
ncbi:MAG: metal ABC transporter permease [Eggerthia catenaformis]|nr:metal ABC transporter permease [Eggerthia catenaformis]